MQVNAAAVVLHSLVRPKAKQSRLFPHPLPLPLPGFSDRWDIPLPPPPREGTQSTVLDIGQLSRANMRGGAGCVMDGLPCGGMLTVTVMHGPYLRLDRGCCIQLPFYLSNSHASPACSWPVSSVADPHYFDADQIPIRLFQFEIDPDPTFRFDGDLDSMFHFNAIRIRIIIKVLRICTTTGL
jgi:hypothetical protein